MEFRFHAEIAQSSRFKFVSGALRERNDWFIVVVSQIDSFSFRERLATRS